MALINFLKPKNQLEQGGRAAATHQGDEMEAEELCPNCHRSVPVSKLWADDLVCSCGHHFRMRARKRIDLIVDEGSFSELYAGLRGGNPLDFPGYDGKVELARRASDEVEGVVCGTAQIGGSRCCLFVMESGFMMGSMGSAVGEKITRLFEYATQRRLPVVGFTVSGGARMQEGLLSLMQMAKTSGALERHAEAGLGYIVLMTNPTYGGVTASFATLGDVILAEPGAMIGFAGPRVIQETTNSKLPENFQTAEFLLEKGLIDRVIERKNQRKELSLLLEAFGAPTV
jgi:acetyl-CoA carboxylase carboxyl transferase subunit beta